MSFEVAGDYRVADELISRLKLPVSAPSLGGVETLITRPVQTSHAELSAEELDAAGISERLIRVAVGIEAAADLCADFEQALEGVHNRCAHSPHISPIDAKIAPDFLRQRVLATESIVILLVEGACAR